MGDAIRALTQRGIDDPAPSIERRPDPFFVQTFYDPTTASHKLTVEPGYVRFRQLGLSDDPLQWRNVTLSGTDLDASTPPDATVTNPGYVYVRVQTNSEGVPQGKATIYQSSTEVESTEHRPAIGGASGVDGDYYYEIARIEAHADGQPMVTRRIVGNIIITVTTIYNHPFKLRVIDDSGPKLQAYFGSITGPVLTTVSGGTYLTSKTSSPLINGGGLIDNPGGGALGQISLSASTTYGAWIKGTISEYSSTDLPLGGGYSFLKIGANLVYAEQTEIVTSSTHVNPEDAAAFTADDTDFAYFYIGKVIVDSDGLATIEQWLRSDLMLPWLTFPDDFISNDSGNKLGTGSDGGAYLADDAFVTGLTSGTDTTAVNNGDGTWTVNYTGT